MTADPGREVSADVRVAASACRQMYVSLVREGFTRREALYLTGLLLANSAGGDK